MEDELKIPFLNSDKKREPLSARLMMIVSVAVWGTVGLFVKAIPLSSGEIALWRAVLAVLLLSVIMLVTGRKIEFGKIKKEIFLLLISGIAIGINWVLLFESYNYTTVSIATLSYYFAPVIVMIACPLLFRERLTAKQIVCFIGSTVGLVLITGLGDPSADGSHIKGILLALGAALLYASDILINKHIKNVDEISRTFLQFVASLTVLIPYVLLGGEINVLSLNASGWICLLTVGFIHTGVVYCMYFSSLVRLSGQKAAILSYIDPLVAVLISVIILKEPLSLTQAIGGAMILAFTMFNEIKLKRKGDKL